MDSDVAGDEPDVLAAAASADDGIAIVRQPRQPRSKGYLVAFIVFSSSVNSLWLRQVSSWDEASLGDSHAVGIALGRWVVKADGDASADEVVMQSFAQRLTRGTVRGFVNYIVEDCVQFDSPLLLPVGSTDIDIFQSVENEMAHRIDDPTSAKTARAWLHEWGLRTFHICRLAPQLAARVMFGGSKCCHSVPLTDKICRSWFLSSRPTEHCLARWRRVFRQSVRCAARHPKRKRWGFKFWTSVPIHRLLRWVHATKDVKDIKRHAWRTGVGFCKVLADGNSDEGSRLLSQLDRVKVSTTVIRQARFRLDAMALKLWRAFLESMDLAACSVVLYIDTSPQWRGLDMVASSFDLVCPGALKLVFQRLFSFVCLEHGQHSAIDKLIALIWQIWLIAGPRYKKIRDFCNSVVGVLTGAGIERLICDYPDVFRS
jgi:hypothetical protein